MVEKGGFCEKLEIYLSELGKWPVWRALLLGQFLSVLLSTMALLSHHLNTELFLNLPTGQNFLHYMLLCIVYTTWLACRNNERGLISVLKARGWRYLLLGLIDVQANTLITLSYQFTNLTSIQLLDCVAIPIVLALSCLILGVRYRIVHVVGISFSLMGIGCLVWSDIDGDKPLGKHQLVGDMVCLGGAVLYGVVTVLQELSVKTTDAIEYLGMLGLYGSVISGAQLMILEKQTLLTVRWENSNILTIVVIFAIIQFVFHSLTPSMLKQTSATCLHISLLTADFYTLMAGLVLLQYPFHLLYFLSFTLHMVGLYIYSIKPTVISAQRHNNVREEPQIEHTRMITNTREYVTPVTPEGNFELVAALDAAMTPDNGVPPGGLPLSMSTDTAFSSFYGSQVFPPNSKTSGNSGAACFLATRFAQ